MQFRLKSQQRFSRCPVRGRRLLPVGDGGPGTVKPSLEEGQEVQGLVPPSVTTPTGADRTEQRAQPDLCAHDTGPHISGDSSDPPKREAIQFTTSRCAESTFRGGCCPTYETRNLQAGSGNYGVRAVDVGVQKNCLSKTCKHKRKH